MNSPISCFGLVTLSFPVPFIQHDFVTDGFSVLGGINCVLIYFKLSRLNLKAQSVLFYAQFGSLLLHNEIRLTPERIYLSMVSY